MGGLGKLFEFVLRSHDDAIVNQVTLKMKEIHATQTSETSEAVLVPAIYMFNSLGVALRSDEEDVRKSAEQCTFQLGVCVAQASETMNSLLDMWLFDVLLPRIAGLVEGGDTASQRKSAYFYALLIV